MKTEQARIPKTSSAFLTNFYKQPAENIDLPDTGIVLGNPKADMTIVCFTDFLCSACHEFYKMEKFFFGKYGTASKPCITTIPLDKDCNREMKRTVYANSCIASRAFIAASDAGIIDEYM